MMAADRKTCALTALAFIVAFAVLTCGIHFASLTVGRQIESSAFPGLSLQLSFGWRTLTLGLDLLTWDFFLGLSMLFAVPVFKGDGLRKPVRVNMIVTGTLCLAGTLGPASGHLHIQYLGIAFSPSRFSASESALRLWAREGNSATLPTLS
jgi:hypothetical protein